MELLTSAFRECVRSWWVLAFAILTFGLYEQSSGSLSRSIDKLTRQATELENSITQAESTRGDLKLQVASQSDPAWIELSLIKGLGLVPEGYTKIYYEEIEAK